MRPVLSMQYAGCCFAPAVLSVTMTHYMTALAELQGFFRRKAEKMNSATACPSFSAKHEEKKAVGQERRNWHESLKKWKNCGIMRRNRAQKTGAAAVHGSGRHFVDYAGINGTNCKLTGERESARPSSCIPPACRLPRRCRRCASPRPGRCPRRSRWRPPRR